MQKLTYQRIHSFTSGIRHRMVYKDRESKRYYIQVNLKTFVQVRNIEGDLWQIKDEKLFNKYR